MARGDYFYKIVQRMRDNTYQIEFSGDMNISITFNVGHLTPYIKDEDEGIEDLRKMPFKRGRFMQNKPHNPSSSITSEP